MSEASSEPVDPPIVVAPGGPALPYYVVALGASAGGLEALETCI